jgi:beta-lactamase superfamily II metal-dependent hydrolase
MKKKIINQLFFILCLLFIILLSYISRPPVYGKLKFILLNTFWDPYYSVAQELDKNPSINPKTFFYSDPVSEYSFFAALGMLQKTEWRILDPMNDFTLPLTNLLLNSDPPKTECIINLRGFPDTWVPRVTRHWDPIISNTSRFYEYNGYTGKKLAITIENKFQNKCILFNDKELPWEDDENFRYRSPNLNYTNQQQDVHILQFRRNPSKGVYNILIDVGKDIQSKDKLLDYLATNEIYKIDEIFITHPHKDHYSGLYELIKFGIPIKRIWMNLPPKDNCDKEIPWGCDENDLKKLFFIMNQNKIEHREIYNSNLNVPIELYSDSFNKLNLLYSSPTNNPIIKNIDINDLSMIIKLNTNNTTYLFTGDLNHGLGEILKMSSIFKADILKVPHHGTEGVASNEFFNTVGARIGIVPSPEFLWCSDRSLRIRNYFKEKKSHMLISGFHGDILIRHFNGKDFEIITENIPKNICGESPTFNTFTDRLKILFK